MTPTSLSLLAALNHASDTTQTLYDLGIDLAKWYRDHAHEHVIKSIAFVIAACLHVWINRKIIRNRIESLFTLDPYTPVNPVEVVEKETAPTLLPFEVLPEEMPDSEPVNRESLLALSHRELLALSGTRSKVSKAKLVDLILA